MIRRILPDNLSETIPIICNTSDKEVLSNVEWSSSLPIPWLKQSDPIEGTALIVGGGPSVRAFIPVIRSLQARGSTVFSFNGTMGMLSDADCEPDYFTLMDARPENVRFLQHGNAKNYLISAQCSPEIFHFLADKPVTLWHSYYEGVVKIVGDRECVLMGGGTTVGLQTLSLAFALGFRNIHLYGFDSSYADGQGHAYAQSENDADQPNEYMVGNKKFMAAAWMARQAMEFQTAVLQLADADAVVTVHGTGLLPEIARHMTLT